MRVIVSGEANEYQAGIKNEKGEYILISPVYTSKRHAQLWGKIMKAKLESKAN